MKTWPQVYSAKFLCPGLVSYEDSGAGIALLKKETIDKMLASFIGRPVCIDHQDITPENYEQLKQKRTIVGNVIRCWYEPADGWFYCDFLVETEEAIKKIEEEGYSVSCAYNVLDAVEGGTYQDIKYDGEITEGDFTHLALVENPRYEESKIMKQFPTMLVNGKVKACNINQEENGMFNIFKKNSKGEKELYNGIVMVNGKEMPLSELVNAYNAKMEEEKKEKENGKQIINSTDIITLNGASVVIGEMIKKVAGTQPDGEKVNSKEEDKEMVEEDKKEASKKNEKDEEKKEEKKENEKEEEGKEEEKKENEKDEDNIKEEEKKKENDKKEEETKENSKKKGEEFFAELHNARPTVVDDTGAPAVPLTRAERASRWAARNKKV